VNITEGSSVATAAHQQFTGTAYLNGGYAPEYDDRQLIRSHVELVHTLAADSGVNGIFAPSSHLSGTSTATKGKTPSISTGSR
jgi:hypothetical protein